VSTAPAWDALLAWALLGGSAHCPHRHRLSAHGQGKILVRLWTEDCPHFLNLDAAALQVLGLVIGVCSEASPSQCALTPHGEITRSHKPIAPCLLLGVPLTAETQLNAEGPGHPDTLCASMLELYMPFSTVGQRLGSPWKSLGCRQAKFTLCTILCKNSQCLMLVSMYGMAGVPFDQSVPPSAGCLCSYAGEYSSAALWSVAPLGFLAALKQFFISQERIVPVTTVSTLALPVNYAINHALASGLFVVEGSLGVYGPAYACAATASLQLMVLTAIAVVLPSRDGVWGYGACCKARGFVALVARACWNALHIAIDEYPYHGVMLLLAGDDALLLLPDSHSHSHPPRSSSKA
jgi:hypothetical protein